MTHYEHIFIPTSKWTEASTTSGPAESAIHCGLRCSKQVHRVCHKFKFEDGVCEVSGEWIQETTEKPSTTVFRKIIGQFSTENINLKDVL